MDNPFDQFDAPAPQAGPGIRQIIPPAPAAGRDPLQVEKDKLDIELKRKALAKADVLGAGAANRMSANQRADALQAYTDAHALERIADKLESQFRAGPGATHGLAGIGDYLPTPENQTFNDTAYQARGRVKRALGFTGGEGNTIGEVQLNYGPFLPEASDFDDRIENKIISLRQLAGDSRARAITVLGGKPDVNGVITPVEEGIELSGQPMPAQTVPVPDGDLPAEAPTIAPSANGFQSVIDPQQQALAGQIGSLIAQGADRSTILRAAIAGGMNKDDPKFLQFAREIDGAIKFRRSPDWQKWERLNKGKAYPISPEFYTREEQLTPPEQLLNKAAQSPGGSFVAGAADTLSGGMLDELVGATGGNAENARVAQDVMGAAHPTANFLGNVTGGTLAALGGEAALSRLGMAPGAGRAMLADVGFGAGYGAGSAEDGNRLQGAGMGALAGAGGNLVGRGTANALGRLTAGVSNPEVRALVKENIPVTLGQALGKSGPVGRIVKGAEDRLSGLPIVGDAINARRGEGIAKMNAKSFDKALEPINKTVGELTGEEAVEQAQSHVGDAFNDALRGKAAAVDRPFITEAAGAKRAIQAIPRVAGEVESSIDEAINSYFDPSGQISGDNMQALLRDLGNIKRGYKSDPLGHRVSSAVGQVEKAVENLFRRQSPDVMPKYDAAKQAFRRVSILEDAVLKGKNTGGKFTPAQLGMADRANAKKFSGTHAAAAGKGEFHDFQRNAQEVLPNQVPDSGTAGRLALPLSAAALSGGGAGIGAAAGDPQSGAKTGLGLAGLLALAYSKTGQRMLVGAAVKRGPRAQAVGKAIKDRARLIGSVGATGAVLGTSPDR